MPNVLRTVFWIAVLWACAAACLLLTACAEPAPTEPATGMCRDAGFATAQAWEEIRGPVPWECWEQIATYEIRHVPRDEMPPCGPDKRPGSEFKGCTYPEAIYIAGNLDPYWTRWAAVHEWVHVLSGCVENDLQMEHTDVQLWSAVTRRGRELTELGECVNERQE